MRIAVVGAGNVGRALGSAWQRAGHDITYVLRDPSSPKHADLDAVGPEGARDAEVILLAVPWAAAADAASALGDVGEAVVIDATNPLGPPAPKSSGAAAVAHALRGGRLVKAFNTTGAENLADARYTAGRPAMFLAGDDTAAKETVASLAEEIGFEPLDAGSLAEAADVEALARVWIREMRRSGDRAFAFALLRRN